MIKDLFVAALLLSSAVNVNGLNGGGPKNPKPPSSDDKGALRPSPFDGFLRADPPRQTSIPPTFRPPPPPPRPRPISPPGALGFDDGTIVLPDGAQLLFPSIRTGFSCLGRIYGYYADVDNDCRIFHICNPFDDGRRSPQKFSFFCGNQTAFNQRLLACDHQNNVDCSLAPLHYSVNENFGRN